MKSVSFKLDEASLQLLYAYALKNNIQKSDVFREAIRRLINEDKERLRYKDARNFRQRRESQGEKMRTVTFKIDDELLAKLDAYAAKHGLDRSEAIRRAVRRLLEEEMKNEVTPALKVEKIRL